MRPPLARLQRALVNLGLVDAHDEVGEGALGDGVELRGGQREAAREEAALHRLRGVVLEASVGWIEAGRAREESWWRCVPRCGKPGWRPVYPGSPLGQALPWARLPCAFPCVPSPVYPGFPLGGKPGVPRPSIKAAGLCMVRVSARACDSLKLLNCTRVAVTAVQLLSLSTTVAACSSTDEITAEYPRSVA